MSFVKHRTQQRMGLVEIPEKERKCVACKVVFKSKSGLFSHQTRKSNPKCHRAGIHRMRADWVKGKLLHQRSWQKKKVSRPINQSVFEIHSRGKSITKEEKQICLNIYQHFLDKGRDQNSAILKAAKVSGISRRSMDKIVKEKEGSGLVTDNKAKFRTTKTMFEKLNEEQVNNIR